MMDSEALHHPGVPASDILQASCIDEKTAAHISDVSSDIDPNVVDFEIDDPENPLNWPRRRKWTVLLLVSTMNALGYVPASQLSTIGVLVPATKPRRIAWPGLISYCVAPG